MRIGFFTDGFLPQPDGVATSVSESAKELRRRGHEVFIIAPKYPGYVDRDPYVIRLTSVKVYKDPEIRMGLSLPDKALRKIISIDFDVIHGHSGGPVTLLGSQIARAKQIPCVITYHTLWNRYTHYFFKGKIVSPKMMEHATKIFGNRVDYLIAPTQRVEKELRSYGVKKPIKVIPSGIDTEKFKTAEKGFLRKKLGIERDPLLLFVGRLGKEKSIDFIIRSFKKIYSQNPSIQLVIVGEGRDRKKLESLGKRLKVLSNLHFVGRVANDDMPKVYQDASVFVFSSTTETQGLVVPEALSSGVPVVAIDDPAYECVKNGENGYLVKKDVGEFASKVLSIIDDKDLQKKLSEGAIESSKELSVVATADDLEDVYIELLNRYNRESVVKIMDQNARNEWALVVSVTFFMTILISRVASFLNNTGSYPMVEIAGQPFHYAEVGVFLMLVFAALLLKKRTPSFFSLVLLGSGLGLVINEAPSLLFSSTTYLGYWNPLNFLVIVLSGIVPLILFNKKDKDHPRFYIPTREQKHNNPSSPKISVVIPAYNEAEFIEPTLKSILNQTYKNFELIVVDNNSTDNTAEVAKRFGAKVVTETIKGVAAARQAGYFAANGEVIASTDADSVVPAGWLEKIALAYEKNDKLVGFGGMNLLYSGPVTARAADRYIAPWFWRIDKIIAGGWNLIGYNMSVRKSGFVKIGGFNPDLKMGEDIDLSQKLRTVGDVGIDFNLMVYSSGRRYSSGLFVGLMSYVPFWISKVLFKRDKAFEFKDIRTEGASSSILMFVPISALMLFLATLFYIVNSQK